jgi:peptidoglycan LD-endopeptidase LytH
LTASRARITLGLTASLLGAVLVTVPVNADTASQLRGERAHLSALQGELNRLAASYAAAQSRLADTQSKIAVVQARVHRVRVRMRTIQGKLTVRAREMFEEMGANSLEILLTSDSFSQFSDRMEYLGRIERGDTDLLVEARVTREQLRRDETRLASLSAREAATVRALAGQKAAIGRSLAAAQSAVASLEKKLNEERAAVQHEATQSGGGALAACPVGQPRAFTDDFGDPRPGGRTHQGIDLLAPLGTPVYAAQTGTFRSGYNELGGISAFVDAGNGDYTYYAHLSSYAGVGSGATVSAGTMIGHVGNTGDAMGGPYHLHFEYHPGGGAAVDPYRMLVAVCG